jgi:hypothetical protein
MDEFVLLEIIETELTKVVHSLRSKQLAGLDDISPYFLKKCVPYTLRPLVEFVSCFN